MPLYAQDIDAIPCAKCGLNDCDDKESDMLACCHPDAGQSVAYNKKTKVLTFRCHKCGKHVSDVMVAQDPNRPSSN